MASCKQCKGTGDCQACGGKGRLAATNEACERCDGTGQCSTCGGSGKE